MPSARMSQEGLLGAGFAYIPPYHTWNLYAQLAPFLEVSGNYRVFRGVDDPILTPLGFGDMSDKGANVKLALFRPEDSDYLLPGIAFGLEDFLGTRNFKAKYVVFTKVFLKEDLELSLGYGAQRIRGWFGGVLWMPFRQMPYRWLQPLSVAAEYDATPYKSEKIEKHPKGRKQTCKINGGIKYRFWDFCDLSLSYVRGQEWAASIATFYDFGNTEGFLPKIERPLLCRAQPQEAWLEPLQQAFAEQEIDLLHIQLGMEGCLETLRLTIFNETYNNACELREQITAILASHIPPTVIQQIIVVVEAEGCPIQEYHFFTAHLQAFREGRTGAYELEILSPLKEYTPADPLAYTTLFRTYNPFIDWLLLPKTHTFFGSSKGKFKYSLGVNFGVEGFLPSDIYYTVLLGWSPISCLYDLHDVDRLNPSQIINVRTDVVRYYQQKGLTLDEAYLQKCWNLGHGVYFRGSLGYFEEEYAGIAGQLLHYPLNSCLALGIEGALFKKRSYNGVGFTSKVRKLDGFVATYKPFPFGSQYFCSAYYDWQWASMVFKVKAGKFLANDYGIRYEISRYFPSGLEVSLWYTHTNGHDKINGHTYYDKGVSFSMPIDIFYMHSSVKRWGYGMSAWLRDVGVMGATGQDLYDLIRLQRW